MCVGRNRLPAENMGLGFKLESKTTAGSDIPLRTTALVPSVSCLGGGPLLNARTRRHPLQSPHLVPANSKTCSVSIHGQ